MKSAYIILITTFLIIPLSNAFSITGNNYDSEQTIISSGGSANTTSTNYNNQLALDQTAIGTATSGSYDSSFGFFFATIGNEGPLWSEQIPTAYIDEDTGWTTHDSDLTADQQLLVNAI